jgi:hypothetical protein
MVDYVQIRLAFRKVLLAISGLPPKERRSWENRTFNPPNPPALWVREALLPVREFAVATGMVQFDGIMVYDVIAPANKGTEDAEDLSKLIADAFKPATGLTDPVQVAIDRCERLQGRDMSTIGAAAGTWWQIPVQVKFRSYAVNP